MGVNFPKLLYLTVISILYNLRYRAQCNITYDRSYEKSCNFTGITKSWENLYGDSIWDYHERLYKKGNAF